MIKILLLIPLVLSFSCNSNQKIIANQNLEHVQSNCPNDGVCTFEASRQKSITISQSSLGEMYPEINNGDKILLKFEYKRNEIQNVMDSSYNEIIYIEVDPDNIEMNLKDSELENVKLIFARFCYCKGQTGYYLVENGNLSIKKVNGTSYQLSLEFKVSEVPQIISSIQEVFDFK